MNEFNITCLSAWMFASMPVFYAVAAVLVPRLNVLAGMWNRAVAVAWVVLAAALAASAGLVASGAGAVSVPLASRALEIRMDVMTAAMTVLIAFISVIILRYAKSYLAGDAGQARFVRWFFGTVASVSLLVAANHLIVMLAGWISASLCLHQLLTYYSSRPQAVLAAHKKFLLSRLADVLLLAGFVTVGEHYGSYRLDQLFAAVGAAGNIPGSVEMAAVLIAMATILKCAQLPFHGWLIQVMEAPTPVSALLHAGVVNIGGFLLIRLAPLMSMSSFAQWLLVVVGSLTAVTAGLIMMTRISIKVMLAWSTCAQMGFMLMECGLGAYPLALLHLLAHSLYKAHCFLNSGRAVEQCSHRMMAPAVQRHRLTNWLLAAVSGVASVAFAAWLFGSSPAEEPALWALAGVVGIGVATLLGEALAAGNGRLAVNMAAGGLGLSVVYFAWHHLFAEWTLLPAAHVSPIPGTVAWVLAVFALQYSLYAAIRIAPRHPWVSELQTYLYHGLYLDELFTRATFVVWPPKMNRAVSPGHHAAVVLSRKELPS